MLMLSAAPAAPPALARALDCASRRLAAAISLSTTLTLKLNSTFSSSSFLLLPTVTRAPASVRAEPFAVTSASTAQQIRVLTAHAVPAIENEPPVARLL